MAQLHAWIRQAGRGFSSVLIETAAVIVLGLAGVLLAWILLALVG
jgi:hypothetical protein